jgi:hypothetical protein
MFQSSLSSDCPTSRRFLMIFECAWHRDVLVLRDELEVVPVQRLDVIRINGVLHDLHPVAWQHGVADVADAVHDVGLVPRQKRRRPRADIRPDETAEFLRLAGEHARLGPELRRRIGFGQHVDALAGGVELPAVITTAQTIVFHDAVHERSATVGAALGHDAVLSFARLEHGPVLAEKAGLLDGELFELSGKSDGVPVVAEYRTHGRSRPDLGEFGVLFSSQHGSSRGWSLGSKGQFLPYDEPGARWAATFQNAERHLPSSWVPQRLQPMSVVGVHGAWWYEASDDRRYLFDGASGLGVSVFRCEPAEMRRRNNAGPSSE